MKQQFHKGDDIRIGIGALYPTLHSHQEPACTYGGNKISPLSVTSPVFG